MKRGAMLTLVILLVAGAAGSQTVLPAANVSAAAIQEPAVALFAGQAITASQLEAEASSRLLKVRNEEYRIKAELARDLAFERLQDAAARELGIDRDELYRRKVTAAAGEPGKEEVEDLLKRYRAQLPPDEAAARAQVVQYLQEQRTRVREQEWRRELLGRAGFRLLIEPPRAKVPISPDDPARGPAEAPIALVEFSDFQCPFCSRVQTSIQRLQQMYGDKLRVVFKQFPLAMHQHARFAAEAALCAGQQGKFWQMHDWLFANQQKIAPESIRSAAPELALDAAAFGACLDQKTFAARVDDDVRLGESIGVTGTPAFLVNGRFLEGAQPFESFQEVIDDELARRRPAEAAR
ncbi:MAG TPA: thioredoxin domain-containing protein [Thermoanaerobaculaceae bacterium]|nr:thioredoxin domain-containing protein [Thermoanaerobaculaceae bacterium]HRS14918.1 thioredoxin domain-containing protein [Thermoanaerobaculaceae bacterium]